MEVQFRNRHRVVPELGFMYPRHAGTPLPECECRSRIRVPVLCCANPNAGHGFPELRFRNDGVGAQLGLYLTV